MTSAPSWALLWAGLFLTACAKKPEDSIPVIEIRGEGKPMTSAQIRALEEVSNGGPLDIKVENTWRPVRCPHAAQRLDFVTFHYKGFLEDGKKFHQSYGDKPVRIQLGTGMAMPGLDKGLRGMCDTELRKISVPYRLSRKNKSKVWKYVPNDEHWLSFSVEMLTVEEWTIDAQFQFLDVDSKGFLTEKGLLKWLEQQRKEYGKTWRNEDIDNVLAVRYYIRYFDIDGDGKISASEFKQVMERDIEEMERNEKEKKPKGRKRDPGVAWILDVNNDGIVSYEENDTADRLVQTTPQRRPQFGAKQEL